MSYRTVQVEWRDGDETPVYTVGVNREHEGLFVKREYSGGTKQWAGTGCFCAYTPAELMRKLWRAYPSRVVRMVRGSAAGWED